ncbi:oxidoreductase [Lysobacter sp. S4-A87]|uniref:oxidoreductase n=1 Tax=Lysobacter sp. S4-A87 TaxID=2925843 RepID=UPI001F530C1E|nr:oxidoreductase [Lysobacter sp. S4-A87]UNK48697.1 oxidoreductase [Lysobacter sp. S4-A87]
MSSASSPIRIALIGYGYAARTFHAPLIQSVAGLSMELVASSRPGQVQAELPGVPVESDPLRAVVAPGIDLVVIATPNDTHFPLAQAALRAGKHVVVDKPMTPDLSEARELSATAKAHGRILSVFHNRRWDSDFISVRQAMREGLIGEARHFESRIERFRPQVRDRWRERPGPATGLWWDLGPHLVDQALALFGWPDTVQANLAQQRSGATTDDWAHVVLGFGAIRAILHAGMLAAIPGPRFVVHGTRGSLVKAQPDRQEQQLIAGLRPGDPEWGIDPDPLQWRCDDGPLQTRAAVPGDQSRFYVELAQAIAGEGPNPVLPEEAIRVMAVMEAAMRAASEGRAVSPELPL